MKIPTIIGTILLMFICRSLSADPVRVIFDTDIGSDCDDAGAMAVLHKLADRGEARILATIFSSRGDVGDNRFGPAVVDAINTWYRRPNLPIGANKGHDVGDPGARRYLRQVGADQRRFGHDIKTTDDVPDMIDVYRQVLAGQPNKKVVIVTVGHPIALYHLLRSGPDDHSPLPGKELVRHKVRCWVAMGGGNDTRPSSPWNLAHNGMANYIGQLLEQWPVDYFNSGDGADIQTGRELPATPADNPVRECYRLWLGKTRDSRSSWDELAVLFAVRGERYFKVDAHGGTKVTDGGNKIYWDPSHDNPLHHRVMIDTDKIGKRALEKVIARLMTEPPTGPEPNDGDDTYTENGQEDFLQFFRRGSRFGEPLLAKTWNDIPGDFSGVKGYVVEWNTKPVPSPSSFVCLLGMGLVWLLRRRS